MNLQTMVSSNENILWRGKPSKKCFILESIFNPLLPFAIIWALFDSFFIGAAFSSPDNGEILKFIIPFMAVHLMPVWMYLGGILLSFRKYKNTEFIVTDKGIYTSGGAFTYNYEMKPFTDLSHIGIHRGIFDQMLGVGDVVSQCNHVGMNSNSSSSHHHGITICDIPDYERVYKMISELQTDIYSDTMYPNDLRPAENHGYRTRYVGDEWGTALDEETKTKSYKRN